MQDIVSIRYIAARKLYVVVNSQVKIWSCTLSSKHCHLTLLCLQHHFGTILTNIYEVWVSFDIDTLAITLRPSRHEELCDFAILIEKYSVLQLLWREKSQSNWRSFHVFSVPKFDLLLSIWWIELHKQLITYHKLTELFFGSLFDKC